MNNQKPLLKVGSNYHKTNLTIIESKQELIEHGYIIEEYKSSGYTDEYICGEDVKGKLE